MINILVIFFTTPYYCQVPDDWKTFRLNFFSLHLPRYLDQRHIWFLLFFTRFYLWHASFTTAYHRWGYKKLAETREQVTNMRQANIPLLRSYRYGYVSHCSFSDIPITLLIVMENDPSVILHPNAFSVECL